jgi:hypothetical protein
LDALSEGARGSHRQRLTAPCSAAMDPRRPLAAGR